MGEEERRSVTDDKKEDPVKYERGKVVRSTHQVREMDNSMYPPV